MNYISVLIKNHIKVFTDTFILVGYIKLENVYTSAVIGNVVVLSALTEKFKNLTYTVINNGVEFKKEQIISDDVNDLVTLNISNVQYLITSKLEYYKLDNNKLVNVSNTAPTFQQFDKIDSVFFDNRSLLVCANFNNKMLYIFECIPTEIVQIQTIPLTTNKLTQKSVSSSPIKLHVYNSELFLIVSNNNSIIVLKYNSGIFSIESNLNINSDGVYLNDDLMFISNSHNSKISTFKKSGSNDYQLEYELRLQNNLIRISQDKNRLFLIFEEYVAIIEWNGTIFNTVRVLDIQNVINLKTISLN